MSSKKARRNSKQGASSDQNKTQESQKRSNQPPSKNQYSTMLSETQNQLKKVTEQEFLANEKIKNEDFMNIAGFFLKHSYNDIHRRKFHFCLAFCSVFLVVVSTLIINQIISKGSIIFLKIGESTHGEIDAFITPAADLVKETIDKMEYDIPAKLNYTATNLYFEQNDPEILDKILLSPRKLWTGVKVVAESKSGLYDRSLQAQRDRWHQTFEGSQELPFRSDTYHVDFPSGLDDNSVIALKTEREREIHIGREYTQDALGVGECMVVQEDESAAGGAKEGDIIFIRQGPINMLPYVNEYERYNQQKHHGRLQPIMEGKHGLKERQLIQRERQLINAHIQMPCKVSFIPDKMGKAPAALKKTIFVEYDNYLTWIADYLPEPLDQNADFKAFLKKQTSLLDEYADQFVLTLPHPRSQHYLQPFDTVMANVMQHMGFVEDSLGYFPITVEAFIMQDFKMAHLSVTFLQLIFTLVMLLLFMISVLLIYSLLMLSVESKSFELGVMRMVGLSKNNVMALVIMQSFMFVIPSIIAGFTVSLTILQGAKYYAENNLQMDFEAIPSLMSVLQALFLSTMIPLISSILPIQIILQRNLNDALDIQRSKTQAVFVNILNKKAANYTPMVVVGCAFTVYGVTIYYLLPLALMSLNMNLLSQIVIFILLGLLFALTILAYNIQSTLERILTHVFLFFELSSMRVMVLKNLSSHRKRNQMTALIYSLALGFLIFLSISSRMQISVSSHEELKKQGAFFKQ